MNFLNKLKSRKFIAAITGAVMGIAMVFGIDKSALEAVLGAVVSIASLITYITVEGKVDAQAIEKAAIAVENAMEKAEDK